MSLNRRKQKIICCADFLHDLSFVRKMFFSFERRGAITFIREMSTIDIFLLMQLRVEELLHVGAASSFMRVPV